MPSILITTKRVLGLAEDYDVFDPDIVMHINSVFADLYQLGVGPPEGFSIDESGDEDWEDYLDDERFLAAQSYMYLRVRMLFDPPVANPRLIDSYEKQIDKMEWRFNVQAEDES